MRPTRSIVEVLAKEPRMRDEHLEAATLLAGAHRTGTAIEPISSTFPAFTLDDAYAVQAELRTTWEREGRTFRGWKVGLTSEAMRAQLGVDQPDSGLLLTDREYRDGDRIELDAFIAPRVEPEIAFVLGSDLAGPGVSLADAASAIAEVRASLEIIDSRIADWRIGIVDTVADNASFGGFVLGTGTGRADATGLDLGAVECTLRVNGVTVATALGDAVLGTPTAALAWLANLLGDRGDSLRAGDVVLPGSLTAAVAVANGDLVHAEFTGIGDVSARFIRSDAASPDDASHSTTHRGDVAAAR